jgi:ATP-dependent DNA helicase RecG
MADTTDPLEAVRAIFAGATPRDLESETLDFKEPAANDRETLKRVTHAALCFANASGGSVVLGVRDDASGPEAFVGTELSREEVQRQVYDSTSPALLVDPRRVGVVVGDRPVSLLDIRVPQSPEIHSDSKGYAPRRVGTDCLPLDPVQQRLLREERLGLDWSAGPSDRAVADIRTDALETARARLARFTDSRRELAKVNDEDLLRALGVVGEGGELLRAGELLFCTVEAGASSPRVLYQHRATAGGEPDSIDRVESPLILAFEETLGLVSARRQLTPVTLPDGQQIQVEDFPELAVREALANALIHREYHHETTVLVDHSPEVFVVSSPGPLVSGVTPSNILTHPSRPRTQLWQRRLAC